MDTETIETTDRKDPMPDTIRVRLTERTATELELTATAPAEDGNELAERLVEVLADATAAARRRGDTGFAVELDRDVAGRLREDAAELASRARDWGFEGASLRRSCLRIVRDLERAGV